MKLVKFGDFPTEFIKYNLETVVNFSAHGWHCSYIFFIVVGSFSLSLIRWSFCGEKKTFCLHFIANGFHVALTTTFFSRDITRDTIHFICMRFFLLWGSFSIPKKNLGIIAMLRWENWCLSILCEEKKGNEIDERKSKYFFLWIDYCEGEINIGITALVKSNCIRICSSKSQETLYLIYQFSEEMFRFCVPWLCVRWDRSLIQSVRKKASEICFFIWIWRKGWCSKAIDFRFVPLKNWKWARKCAVAAVQFSSSKYFKLIFVVFLTTRNRTIQNRCSSNKSLYLF